MVTLPPGTAAPLVRSAFWPQPLTSQLHSSYKRNLPIGCLGERHNLQFPTRAPLPKTKTHFMNIGASLSIPPDLANLPVSDTGIKLVPPVTRRQATASG